MSVTLNLKNSTPLHTEPRSRRQTSSSVLNTEIFYTEHTPKATVQSFRSVNSSKRKQKLQNSNKKKRRTKRDYTKNYRRTSPRGKRLVLKNKKVELKIRKVKEITADVFHKIFPAPPLIFTKLRKIIRKHSLDFHQLFPSYEIEMESIPKTLSKFSKDIQTDQEFQKYLPKYIPKHIFYELYQSYFYKVPPKIIELEEVEDLFRHISLKMQLQKIPKDRIVTEILKRGYNENSKLYDEDILSIFQQIPFKISDLVSSEEMNKLASFLLQSKKKIRKSLPILIVTNKILKYTENWLVFTSEEEDSFDNILLDLLSGKIKDLKTVFVAMDEYKTGLIPINDFYRGLSSLNITIEPTLKSYINLLMYSQSNDLHNAPYLLFLNTYSSDEDSETENLNVRNNLEIIAEALQTQKQSVKSVFRHRRGFISPDGFFDGLERLGIDYIEENELLSLFEALQYEGEDRSDLCISLRELERIFDC